MTRQTLAAMAAGAAMFALHTSQAQAQVKVGYTDVGAVIGVGGINDASFSVGGRFEKVFKKLPSLGDGLLGIGVSADVYSYDAGLGSIRFIPIGATANYHFKLDPKTKLDLFLGAGLGFSVVSCSGFDNSQNTRLVSAQVINVASRAAGGCFGAFDNELYFIGRAGGRYFLSPKTAIYADLGAGAATVNVGVTFKLR